MSTLLSGSFLSLLSLVSMSTAFSVAPLMSVAEKGEHSRHSSVPLLLGSVGVSSVEGNPTSS